MADGLCLNMVLVESFEPSGNQTTRFTMTSGAQFAVDTPYVDIDTEILNATKVVI